MPDGFVEDFNKAAKILGANVIDVKSDFEKFSKNLSDGERN